MVLPTFLTISAGDVTTTIGYASDFIADTLPLLLPVIGLMIGFLVFWAIIGAGKR